MTCNSCPKRKTCTELCAEAEKFVSQDNTPEHTRGREIIYSLRFLASWTNTAIDLDEIAERKKDELIFYFQKIHGMPDSMEKAILAMTFFEIPVNLISKYIHLDRSNIFRRLQAIAKEPIAT